MATGLHTIRVEVPRAETVFTKVALDGQPLLGVTRIRFDSGDVDANGLVKWTIELYAGVDIEGVAEVDIDLGEPARAGVAAATASSLDEEFVTRTYVDDAPCAWSGTEHTHTERRISVGPPV